MNLDKPPDGVNFYITWSLIEWALTGMLTLGAAVAAWVWNLGGRTARLSERVRALEDELRLQRQTVRTIGNALDVKINEETQRLEDRMDRLMEKMDEIVRELPSRTFIEAQLVTLSSRIDRMIDVKLAGR